MTRSLVKVTVKTVKMPPRKRVKAEADGRGKAKLHRESPSSWKYRGESKLLTRQLIEHHGKPERTSDPLNEYNITQGHHQVCS